jgi:hypothetical protein
VCLGDTPDLQVGAPDLHQELMPLCCATGRWIRQRQRAGCQLSPELVLEVARVPHRTQPSSLVRHHTSTMNPL